MGTQKIDLLFEKPAMSVTEIAVDEPFQKRSRCPFDRVPGALPLASIPAEVDLDAAASWGIAQLSDLKAEAFASDCLWRDLYALTGLPRTFYGADKISAAWDETIKFHKPTGFRLSPSTARLAQIGPANAWVSVRYTFETCGQPPSQCSGQIGLVPDPERVNRWKIWHLSTILENLVGFPSPDAFFPEKTSALSNGVVQHPEANEYDCCVIGAGFAGLCLSARFEALGVKYVTLEANKRVGDNWRNRYRSATFHTARDFSDFPLGRMFTEDDPYFLNVKQLARGYEEYANKHKLNIRTSSTLTAASYNNARLLWTLTVMQDGGEMQITTKHFVLAIGGAGQTPVMPDLVGRDDFQGIALHSSQYQTADEWRGKKGVVIGTANTGHDVAEDMLEAGLGSVTMIQRGETCVFPTEVHRHFAEQQYKRELSIEECDRGLMGYPNSIIRQMQLLAYKLFHEQDPHRYDGLEKAGFRVGRDGDLWDILCGKQGGHYVDVGTSKKIADGLIKVKNGSVVGFTPSGLRFQDGTTLDADVVIFCTGFANDVREQAVQLVGPEIGQYLEDYFYVDDEGEILGAWKPQGHPGIWYTGGGVHCGRFFSRFLALQIQADTLGTPLKLYKKKLEEKAQD